MHRFWIALALALALALSACAEETVPAGGAEDALTIEDPGFDGIEPVIDDAGGLLSGDLALNAADGLLSGDLALDAETVGALPGADNGAEANRFTNIRTWFDFVNKDLPDASNGDTLAFTTGVFVGTESAHIDKSITMLLQNDVLFLGEYTATPLICIYSDVDVLLTGYGGHFLAGRNPAMWVLDGGRFTMDGYCTTISEFNYGVRNNGVFTMKGGSLFKNKCGVENTDVFIIDGTSYECTITDNEQGVVAPLTSHNNSTAVTVSGDVSIRDNKECDVLLQKGQVVALGGPLLKRSSIGITLSEDNQPGPDSPVVVTRGLKGNGTADNFFVWGDYETGINADGELEVRKKGPILRPLRKRQPEKESHGHGRPQLQAHGAEARQDLQGLCAGVEKVRRGEEDHRKGVTDGVRHRRRVQRYPVQPEIRDAEQAKPGAESGQIRQNQSTGEGREVRQEVAAPVQPCALVQQQQQRGEGERRRKGDRRGEGKLHDLRRGQQRRAQQREGEGEVSESRRRAGTPADPLCEPPPLEGGKQAITYDKAVRSGMKNI